MNTVAISDMFEIQSGQLAAGKAQNSDVKSFGQEMVDDHSKTSDQLKDLVKDEDIKAGLPAALDDKHQPSPTSSRACPASSSTAYVDMQVKAHEKAVSLFEAYATAGENDDLKDWAEDTVPTLKEHLKEAQDLNAKVDQVAEANDTNKADDRAMRDDNAMGHD